MFDVYEPIHGEIYGNGFLNELKKKDWDNTLTVKTPKKGIHYYFQYDDIFSQNKATFEVYSYVENMYLGVDKKYVSIDIRNDGECIYGPNYKYMIYVRIDVL